SVEDKGLTLAVHYRRAPPARRDEVRHIVETGVGDPFGWKAGAMVYDIRPRVEWNKGAAINWMKNHLNKPQALVFFVGDDATDEEGFAALPEGITVKVGPPSPTAARYSLADPAEVQRFLQWLLDLVAP